MRTRARFYSDFAGRVLVCFFFVLLEMRTFFRFLGSSLIGLSRIASWLSAAESYSRLPQISHTQAGKSGTVINSSPSQVK